MIFALEGKTGMRCRVLWSGERIGVVELVTHVHVQIVGPRGMGSSCRSSISISFFLLLPSFLCQ